MKKIKKLSRKNVRFNTSPEIQMSALIGEYASDYINMGDTNEERENFLRGACTAWNIANLPEHLQEKALRQAADEYQRMNPGIDDADNYLRDMRKLIKKKLRMFPDIKKAIVDAYAEPISDTQYRINVVSTDKPGDLYG